MANFFKNIGKGVLYVLSFPFIILAIALAGVAGVLIFIYEFFKIIILFFAGRSIFKPLDEDIKAKAILDGYNNQATTDTPKIDQQDDYQVYTTGNFTNTAPVNDDNDKEGDDEND